MMMIMMMMMMMMMMIMMGSKRRRKRRRRRNRSRTYAMQCVIPKPFGVHINRVAGNIKSIHNMNYSGLIIIIRALILNNTNASLGLTQQ